MEPEVAALAAQESVVSGPSITFAANFGTRGLDTDLEVLDMPERNLIHAWQACVKEAVPAGIRVEDEISKSVRAHVCSCGRICR